MKSIYITILLLLPFVGFSQNWLLVDIISQSKKEVVYMIDNGDTKKKKRQNNPSVVKLIGTFEEDGYTLFQVTQGVELDLTGNFPIGRTNQNWAVNSLLLSNNNRVMLWFKKNK